MKRDSWKVSSSSSLIFQTRRKMKMSSRALMRISNIKTSRIEILR